MVSVFVLAVVPCRGEKYMEEFLPLYTTPRHMKFLDELGTSEWKEYAVDGIMGVQPQGKGG